MHRMSAAIGRTGLLLSAGALVVLSAAGAAHGSPDVARERLRSGDAAFDRKDYESARAHYAEAYRLIPSVDILWSLSMAELRAGRCASALGNLRAYINHAEAREKRVREARSDLIPHCARRVGRLRVYGDPGMRVSIDGGPFVEHTIMDADPGLRRVFLRTKGRGELVEVTVRVGEETLVSFPEPPGKAHTDPRPAVTILPVHTADKGTDAPGAAKLVTTIVLGSASLLALGMGTYFQVDANARALDASNIRATSPKGFCLDRSHPTCQTLSDNIDAANTSQLVATSLFASGAVLGAAAALTWWLWPNAKGTSRVMVAPSMGPDYRGLSLRSAF